MMRAPSDQHILARFDVGHLEVRVYASVAAMASSAAMATADAMRQPLPACGSHAIVFASAPSQTAFLESLAGYPSLPWSDTVAFHLDEYVGLPRTAEASFARFLAERLFSRVPLAATHYLDGTAAVPSEECARYTRLLRHHPLSIACIGVGENGHIAFNEPGDTDFEDARSVRVVRLDETSRRQQVRDGCFADLAEVPREAITLTVPAIMAATTICCVVPGRQKASAIQRMLQGPVAPSCPASVLRRHSNALLFLDRDAASELNLAIND